MIANVRTCPDILCVYELLLVLIQYGTDPNITLSNKLIMSGSSSSSMNYVNDFINFGGMRAVGGSDGAGPSGSGAAGPATANVAGAAVMVAEVTIYVAHFEIMHVTIYCSITLCSSLGRSLSCSIASKPINVLSTYFTIQ